MKDYGHYHLFRQMTSKQAEMVKTKMDEGWKMLYYVDNKATLQHPHTASTITIGREHG